MAQLKLGTGVAAGWAAAELGIALHIGVAVSYVLFYLTRAHGMDPATAGLVILLGRLCDIIVFPVVGLVSDRANTRWGRRRPFILGGSIFYALAISIMFSLPDIGMNAKIWLFLISYALANMALTVIVVPYLAMVPEMTQDYDERTALAGYRMIVARLGIIAATLVVPWVFQSEPTLVAGFRLVGFLLAFTVLAGGIICFIATRDTPRFAAPASAIGLHELRETIGNKVIRSILVPFLFQNMAVGAAATTLVYFLVSVASADARLAVVLAVSSFLFTPMWIRAARRLEKKSVYLLALAVTLAAIGLIAGPWPISMGLVLVFLIVLGLGDAGTQLAPNAMISDSVEAVEAVTGTRREGLILASFALTIKIGMALGGFAASMVLQAAGLHGPKEASGTDAGQVQAIWLAYTGLPGLFWIAAMIGASRYSLDRAEYSRLKGIVRQRAGTAAEEGTG